MSLLSKTPEHQTPYSESSGSSSSGFVEEAVDLLSCSLTHDGLQLVGGGIAELVNAGELLQQRQSFDPADPGDSLHQNQDLWVQQQRGTPPPEGVLSTLPVDLETVRAGWKINRKINKYMGACWENTECSLPI